MIITTLASRAYELCVRSSNTTSELELLCDVRPPHARYDRDAYHGGQTRWYIWNETTEDENFAEKWNKYPERAAAFFAWHARVCRRSRQVGNREGLDELRHLLGGVFGSGPAANGCGCNDRARDDGSHERPPLGHAGGGLLVGTQAASTSVRANTFFGRDR